MNQSLRCNDGCRIIWYWSGWERIDSLKDERWKEEFGMMFLWFWDGTVPNRNYFTDCVC